MRYRRCSSREITRDCSPLLSRILKIMSLLSRLFRRKPRTWRDPQLAGHLYPADADALRALVTAGGSPTPLKGQLRALIVPFAELSYMHAVARPAWSLAAGGAYTRAVMLAPALRLPFAGLAAPSCEAFRSPLGDAWLDRVILDELTQTSEAARIHDPAHEVEMALEVMVPYAQVFIPDAQLVPILVGDGAERAAQGFLDVMAQQPGSLLVVGTELSRALPLDEARALDAQTLAHIEALDADALTREHVSSKQAVAALLRVARAHGWTAHTLGYDTSATHSGDVIEVVGYGAVAFTG
jgi:hypothetical protein